MANVQKSLFTDAHTELLDETSYNYEYTLALTNKIGHAYNGAKRDSFPIIATENSPETKPKGFVSGDF